MQKLISTIKLVNETEGHSKFWIGRLFEDGCQTEWGKIDGPSQSKDFPGEGIKFYNKKIAEKAKRGYEIYE